MKKCILLLAGMLLGIAGIFAANDSTAIRVRITVDQVPEYGVTVYGTHGRTTFNFKDSKQAEWVAKGLDAVFFLVQNGFSERKPGYAEAGDELEFAFDGVSMARTLRVEGARPAIFRYLEKKVQRKLEDEVFKQDVAAFATTLARLEAANLALLDSLEDELRAESRLFVRLERARVHYDACLYWLDYAYLHPRLLKQEGKGLPAEYYDTLEKQMAADEQLLCLAEYRGFISGAAKIIGLRGTQEQSDYGRLLVQVTALDELCRNQAVKEDLIHTLVCEYVRLNGIRTTKELDALYRRCVADPGRMEHYQAIYDSWVKLEPGKPALGFKATDKDGKEYTLRDLGGKNVCLYLWQNVYPCIREFEALEALAPWLERHHMQLVNLFIGSNRKEWLEAIGNEKLQTGLHLFLGNDRGFLDGWHFDSYGVFRYIWIDADGKIIRSHAPKASSGEWENSL